MKKDRKIEEYVQNTTKQYQNPEFLESLKSEAKRKQPWISTISRKTLYILSGCAIGAIVTAVVLLCVFLIKPYVGNADSQYAGGKAYFDVGNDWVGSTVEEINECTEYIDLVCDNIGVVTKTFDRETDETLGFHTSYSVMTGKAYDNMTIHVIVSPNYQFFVYDTTDWEHTTFEGFDLVYNEWTRPSGTESEYDVSEGIAAIITDKEIIYVNYEGFGEGETNNMLESISVAFELKK